MKNKINALRRGIVVSVWTTPIISAVALPVHAQTSQIESPALTLALNSATAKSTYDGTTYTVSGSVTATPTVDDLSGVMVNIELGPSDTFTTDVANTGAANIVSVVTAADGSFSITGTLIDESASNVCTELGYEITLDSAAAFETNNSSFAVTLESDASIEASMCTTCPTTLSPIPAYTVDETSAPDQIFFYSLTQGANECADLVEVASASAVGASGLRIDLSTNRFETEPVSGSYSIFVFNVINGTGRSSGGRLARVSYSEQMGNVMVDDQTIETDEPPILTGRLGTYTTSVAFDIDPNTGAITLSPMTFTLQ